MHTIMDTEPVQQKPTRKIHPQKFAMWFALGSITLMFAGFTSAYLVRRGQGNWEQFDMPQLFMYSTVAILLSSLTLHFGIKAYKQGKRSLFHTLLLASIGLGIVFMLLQLEGFRALAANNIKVNGNVSNSFFYVIAGAHLVHILGGVIALIIVYLRNTFGNAQRNPVGLEIVSYYWHFVDILWVYLYVFLWMYR